MACEASATSHAGFVSAAGLERDKFDNKTVSFEEHIKLEHNIWNYLYFTVLVREKNKTDYTGPESYVAHMIKVRPSAGHPILSWFTPTDLRLKPVVLLQNNNLDWFPRMQAMSLVVTEGDGEQNEMRMLQDKLGATMKVVATLTTQLTELKEQVHTHARFTCGLRLSPRGFGGQRKRKKKNKSQE